MSKSIQFTVFDVTSQIPTAFQKLSTNYYKLAIVLDAQCSKSSEVLTKSSDENLFSLKYHWLMFNKFEKISVKLSGLNIGVDSEILVAVKTNQSNYVLYDVYNTGQKQGGELNITACGMWDETVHLRFNLTESTYNRRANMGGLTLNAATVIRSHIKEKMEDFLISESHVELDPLSRYATSLNLLLIDIFNITLRIKRVSTWGYLVDGKLDGMVAEFEKGHVDIAASTLVFRPERYKVFDYLTEICRFRVCFMFRHPKVSVESRNVFIRPLDILVWFCALILIVIIIIILKYIFWNEERYNHQSVYEFSWSSLSIVIISAVSQQGPDCCPYFLSGRIIIFIMLLFSVIFYQFYSSSIVSTLLIQSPKTIKTVKDLIQSDLKIGSEDAGYMQDWFKSPNGIELYNKKMVVQNVEQYYSPNEGLSLAQRGGLAYAVNIYQGYRIVKDTWSPNAFCDYAEVQVMNSQTVHGVRKKALYRNMFTIGLQHIIESGIAARKKSIWFTLKPECLETTNIKLEVISFGDIYHIFVLLAISVGVSVTILFLEIIISKMSRRFQRNDMLALT